MSQFSKRQGAKCNSHWHSCCFYYVKNNQFNDDLKNYNWQSLINESKTGGLRFSKFHD